MSDSLIPVGGLLFLVLFIVAFVVEARRQREAKRKAMRRLADQIGLPYSKEDPGVGQEFARGFDGIGRFQSPSLGEMKPQDVVAGNLGGLEVVLFRHKTRLAEGDAREWFVAGILGCSPSVKRCSVELTRTRSAASSRYLTGDVIREADEGSYHVTPRAPDSDSAGSLLNPGLLGEIARTAESLPFRPEIQILDGRVAVYLADRNESLEGERTLQALLGYARHVVEVV